MLINNVLISFDCLQQNYANKYAKQDEWVEPSQFGIIDFNIRADEVVILAQEVH